MQDRELQLAQTAIQSGADAGKVAAMYKQRTGKDFPSQTQTGQSSNRTFIANKNPNEISTTSSDQPPADNIWSHGILGKLTDQLPFIGSVGGSILGGTAGTAVAPGIGTVGGAAAGGAAGGAGGEALRELLQGKKANTNEIGKQAIFGGIGGAVGEGLGYGLGKAAGIASHIAVVGSAIKGISDLGDSALMKIFGAGDVEAGAGVKELVNTAKNYGLHNASGIEEVATKTLSAQEKVGTK